MIRDVAPSSFLLSNIDPAMVPHSIKAKDNATVTSKSIVDLGIPLERICLLDSESDQVLTPQDASIYSHYLIGGILGNTDEFDFDRTSVLRKLGFPTRNLGSVQMTSDTAMRVVHRIIEGQTPFDQLGFVDRPEISASKHEQLILNFRFLANSDGSPIIADGIKELLLAESGDFDIAQLE